MIEIPIHCKFDDMIEIDTLKFHPMNANTHSEEQIERLAKILEYQGWRHPVKVSIQSQFITSGHGRVLAAKKLGLKSVPVNFQNYANNDMEIADLHADNEIARWSDLDMTKLNESLADLDPTFDLELLGIEDFSIDGNIEEQLKNDKFIADAGQFIVAVKTNNESEMQNLFEELQSRGFECKLIT